MNIPRLTFGCIATLLISLGPVARAQIVAKTRQAAGIELMRKANDAFKGDKKLLMRYADVYGYNAGLRPQSAQDLQALGFGDEDKRHLLFLGYLLKTRFSIRDKEDEGPFWDQLQKELSSNDAGLLSNPATSRTLFTAGIGPMWEDIENLALRVGNARLGMSMTYQDGSSELMAHWVRPQRLFRMTADKHPMAGEFDLTEAFHKIGLLAPPAEKKAKSKFGSFLSKVSSTLDVTDSFVCPEFPVPQLYTLSSESFSVRFRSTTPIVGKAIYLIPLYDRSDDDNYPAFGWYAGKKDHVPSTALNNAPYQTRTYTESVWAGMYGVVGNYPNGVRAGWYMAVLAPIGHPFEAEQAFLLCSSTDLANLGLDLQPWW